MLECPSDLEIVMRRNFKASAQTVFEVWTKAEHVPQWYAVRSTTMTVCEIDLRVRGAWRWVIVKPNGFEIAFSGIFLELDPPRFLKRTERFEAMPDAECIVTQVFDEQDGQTTLVSTMLFRSKEDRDMCLKSGMELGVEECYEKIDRILESLQVN